ncbi:MAG: Ribonuclease [Planctomycetota bacterium]
MDNDNQMTPTDPETPMIEGGEEGATQAAAQPDAREAEAAGAAADNGGTETDTDTDADADTDADTEIDHDEGSPEFASDPGMGFGFLDADDLEAEQTAETEAAPELTPEERDALAQADQEALADAEDAAAAYARASMRDFETLPEPVEADEDDPLVVHRGEKPSQLVIVNDVPGDETRIAILEHGRLMQFFSERAATSTNVGSIYKARVVNVEPAIQAAFVDFGEGANGFLHISDLHPKYFPAARNSDDKDKKVEKVGKKIPRRARPLIQDALKRGMEITVQVLKEGIGSKGPTVTSYLSIPGRLLVMMPDMDNVGVSRKVGDEEGRRKMRKILDSLKLPDGFGFILRTAGFEATRTELARDAQYLTRLWQVMEKRMGAVGAPCQLYTEGDILLRTIRDSIDASVDGIVCDSESSFHRAKAFLEVVSPRTAAKVHFWDRRSPIFNAFDVERQVDLIHAREVPLPSGGALVIDQAEALVAIDVNSGRSRSARDSETNAFQTNQEAVDEIARQLRLRDLGGVIVNDLIDMRSSKHRREIEDRLRKHFQKDRAKTTVAQISEFGIVEMTRQRMRPSLRKTHYMECPHCQGLGEIRMPDTVASDAMRRIQRTLDMAQVARVEVVCSAKVAGVLLSRKRRALVELEDLFAKRIEVRISDAIAVDRVDLYAYDQRGADVELDRPQKVQLPAIASLPTEIDEERGDEDGAAETRGEGGGRRRRRRRRKPAAADATSMILSGGFEDLPDLVDEEPSLSDALDAEELEAKKVEAKKVEARKVEAKRRADDEKSDKRSDEDGEGEGGGRRRRRRRRGGRGRRGDGAATEGATADGAESGSVESDGEVVEVAAKAPPAPPREPSDPIRVHAIAKEMELTSKEVLAKCAELGIEVKGHQSLLTGEQGDELRKAYGKPPFDVPEPEPEPEAEPAEQTGDGEMRRKRKRRRRGRRDRDDESRGDDAASGDADETTTDETTTDETTTDEGDDAGTDESADAESNEAGGSEGTDGESGGRKRRRRRRGGRGRNRGDRGDRDGEGKERSSQRSDSDRPRGDRPGRDSSDSRKPSAKSSDAKAESKSASSQPKPAPEPAAKPAAKPRTLYGGRVRKLAPGERPKGGGDD